MKKQDKKIASATDLRKKAEAILKNQKVKKLSTPSEIELLKLIHELEVHQIELEMQNNELNIANEKAKLAEDKYTELFDFAPIGYLTVSKDGKITKLNFAAANLLNTDRLSLINKYFISFIADDYKKTYSSFLENIFLEKEKQSCEIILKAPIKPPIFALIDGVRTHQSDYCLIELVDITEKVKQYEELEHLNSVKTKFLSLVSHDLRGSLGSVKMFLDLLITDLDKMDEVDLPTILKHMRDNVNSSHEALEDLLVWSKSDLVNIEPNLEKVDLVGIIEDIFTTIQTPILLKDIEVTKEYFSNEVYVSTDHKMMTVILRNLLTNAIKYTNKHGKIFIRILNGNKHHVIEIEDTGIGMSQSFIDNLFSYDKNHSEQGTDGESSAGIGLILIKEFIEKINGSISVTSELGRGSLFRLTI